MFGAIIGDLVVWTYLRDKEEFFSRLIGNHAKVSELTITILWVAKKTSNRKQLEDNHLLNQFQDWLIKSQLIYGVKLSEVVKQWINHPNIKMHNFSTGMFLMCQGAYSYWYDCDSSKCDL